MLVATRDVKVKRFVYTASTSTYGDHLSLFKVEDEIGKPLSPYSVTKYVNELYADVFSRRYGIEQIGLRYFNIFGPRQDPDGAYVAVNQVYNITVGDRTTLNQLLNYFRDNLSLHFSYLKYFKPVYREFRSGDVRQQWRIYPRLERRWGMHPRMM